MSDSFKAGLHRFSVLTACVTFVLVIAGGLVTSTDSGLAVPDWPLSYGQLMPPMVGGILYEHGHRMIATLVGILTIVLCIWLWKAEHRRWVRILGVVALAAVIFQGVLGGLTVLFLLPTAISVSHGTIAQLFFSLTVLIAVVTSNRWLKAKSVSSDDAEGTRRLSVMLGTAVLVQLVLGAVMRHTGSGLAVPDFPLAYGTLWPSLDAVSLQEFNDQRIMTGFLPVNAGQIAIHMLHRIWAVVVLVLSVLVVRRIFRRHASVIALRDSAMIFIVLVSVQVLLGALTVWTGRSIEVATAHVGTGALILASAIIIGARSFALLARPGVHRIAEALPAGGTKG